MNAWRIAINAVLSTFLIAGMTSLPTLGNAAYAQSVGDTRTVQQDAGTRTDLASTTSTMYDPGTGITTIRRKQDTVRLYSERTETYRQTGNREETRYRQEPVYEIRYRKEQRQRQEQQQVARTGYREETRTETRYRDVTETKTRQVEHTGYRTETRTRTEYEPVFRTEAAQEQEAYTEYGWRWETRTTYSWQWVTHTRTKNVLRWYTSPDHTETTYEPGWVYPGGTWGRVARTRWVSGYRYSVWETESVPYKSFDLVATPTQECVSYPYTAYRPVTRNRSVFSHWRPYTVSYTEQVPYTYYATETHQEPVYDVTGYRDVYGYTWVDEPYRSHDLLYPSCTYGYVDRTRRVWKYSLLGHEPIKTPRQEAYQVPVTVKVAYTYYEPVPVTVTYYVDVPYEVQVATHTVGYQVVVPVFDWVPDSDWMAKEEVIRTTYRTVGRVDRPQSATEAPRPTEARSSTFLSDNNTGTSNTQITGSRKRLILKTDQAITSVAKKVEAAEEPIRSDKGPQNERDRGHLGLGRSTAPTLATSTFTADAWLGTWTQGPYSVTIVRDGDGIHYTLSVRNGGAWVNGIGGSLSNGNATFTDYVGGEVGTSAHLILSRVGGSQVLRITGTIRNGGTRYTFDNLRK